MFWAFPLISWAQTSPTLSYDHSALLVSNLERSAAFYSDVLLLSEIPTPADNPTLRWFDLGNGLQLHLIQGSESEIPTHRAIHLALRVDDFSGFVSMLENSKTSYYSWLGEVNQISLRPDGIQQVYIQDPDGHWIEINDVQNP